MVLKAGGENEAGIAVWAGFVLNNKVYLTWNITWLTCPGGSIVHRLGNI